MILVTTLQWRLTVLFVRPQGSDIKSAGTSLAILSILFTVLCVPNAFNKVEGLLSIGNSGVPSTSLTLNSIVRLDDEDPTGHLVFIILDGLNNISGLSKEERDDLLLQKEKFWIGTLCTMHKGMNSTHDWNRTKRCDKEFV